MTAMPIERSELTKIIIVVKLSEPIIPTSHSSANQILHPTATLYVVQSMELMHSSHKKHGDILVGKKVVVVAAECEALFLAKLNGRIV